MTAGSDLVPRQAGYEKRVVIAQFLKNGTGEKLRTLQALSCAKVHTTQMPQGFYSQVQEQERLTTRRGIQEPFAQIKNGMKECTCTFLDEILDVAQLGLLKEKGFLHFLQEYQDLEIIPTNRNLSQELLDVCNYHTEMVEHRYPYQKGIAARKGVEYQKVRRIRKRQWSKQEHT